MLICPYTFHPEDVSDKTKEVARVWMQVANPPSSHASGDINGTLTFPVKFIHAYILSSGTLNRAHLTCNDTFYVQASVLQPGTSMNVKGKKKHVVVTKFVTKF
jgi:hypothetical protein